MATKEELEQQLEVARRDIETLATMAGGTVREQVQSGVDRAGTEIEHLSAEARALPAFAASTRCRLLITSS